jgi:translation initiation factor IF-2
VEITASLIPETRSSRLLVLNVVVFSIVSVQTVESLKKVKHSYLSRYIMAHKARRRPSWKKRKSKYFDRLKNELIDRFALEIRKEIDKEILEHILKHIKGA